MNKLISVIIPCFNATKWLPKCFVSLAEQTIGIDNLELIFVNDASTDEGKTWEMLQEFEKAFPESIIIIDLPENRRQGGARNEGLKYASGEYLAYVDADDWILPETYEKVYGKAKDMDADIVQFNHDYYFDGVGLVPNKHEMQDELIEIQSAEDRKRLLTQEKLTYGCWNKLYRRQMVMEAGVNYAEHVVYEEPLFVYPLLFRANVIAKMSDRLYIYRQNNAGTMWSYMKTKDTLLQHASVQLQVWEFMKNSEFFEEYYEEIKMYFLHTYLFEVLDFAKRREMTLEYEAFEKLANRAKEEVEDIAKSKYSNIVVKQMELYRLIADGLSKEEYMRFVESI